MKIVSPELRSFETPNGRLLFHRFYGNAKEVSVEIAQRVFALRDSKQQFQTPSEVGLEFLTDSGLLVPVGTNERAEQKENINDRAENASKGKYIHSLQLNVSELCNLACKYCIQARGEDKDRDAEASKQKVKIMPWETAKKSVDIFMDLMERNGNHRGHVMFFGGEPLTNWSVVEGVMDYVAQEYGHMNISYVSTSNGTLITDRMADKMAEHNMIFQASLDGLRDVNDVNRIYESGRGSFDAVNRSLETLARAGVNINLGTVITDASIRHLTRNFVDYAVSLGITNMEVNPEETLFKSIKKAEITEKLYELIKYGTEVGVNVFSLLENPLLNLIYHRQGACSAAGTTFSVEPSGEVYLCRCLSQSAGEIDDVESLLGSDYFNKMAVKIEGNIDNCRKCDIEGLCSGGCSANAENLVGNVYANDVTRCRMAKDIAKKELQEMGLRKPSDEAVKFMEQYSGKLEYDIERGLIGTKLNFWDKEIIRSRLGVESEREYVPVRMIDY